MELNIPAIKGIGDSLIYLVDRYPAAERRPACRSTTSTSCRCRASTQHPAGAGLTYIDHLTHNVHRGRMDEWASFYERLFNFREVRYFDIEGKLTGLKSQGDDESLRQDPHPDQRERRRQEPDPGIPDRLPRRRHPARRARHRRHLRDRRDAARQRGVAFQDTPDTYYEALATRLPGHREDAARLARNRILIDGAPAEDEMLLQIFTTTVIGPIFFEIIQRKGNEGFGEGNFRALFESIELDQIRRGVLKGMTAVQRLSA